MLDREEDDGRDVAAEIEALFADGEWRTTGEVALPHEGEEVRARRAGRVSGRAERAEDRIFCSVVQFRAMTVRLGLTPRTEDRMSIVVRLSPTNVTRENYDEVASRLESAGVWPNPEGLEFHVLFGSEGNLRVSEIWDSREQFEAFGEHLMPILADVGIGFSADPEVFEVHNIVKR